MNKFKKELFRFYIKVEDDKYYFFKYVIVEGNNKNIDYFIINFCVIWKGNNLNLVKKIIDLCFFNCI